MGDRILAFTVVASLLTITPGVDMALVTRNGVQGGMPVVLRTSAGIITGLVVWAFAAVAGVAAVLAASATALTVLKLAGAAYLVYLGVRVWLGGGASAPRRGGSAFRQGLLSNLVNPKIAVFYTSVIPQFVVTGDPLLLPALLAAIHIATGVVWLPAYGYLVTRAGRYLRRPRVERAVARVTGAILVALGVRLALDRR